MTDKTVQKKNRFTAKGTMPAALAKRHKLIDSGATHDVAFIDPKIENGYTYRRSIKGLVQYLKTYRLVAHKVTERKLARSLVLAARSFYDPLKPEPRKDKVTAETPEAAVA